MTESKHKVNLVITLCMTICEKYNYIISQHNHCFFQHTLCSGSQAFWYQFWRECWLWTKPHMHCVLNFIITGKSSSMRGFF